MQAQKIIDIREETHGDYTHTAATIMGLQDILQSGSKWKQLTYQQRHGLEMILVKLGRMVNGNPHHSDHIDDIIGYATLVKQSMEKET